MSLFNQTKTNGTSKPTKSTQSFLDVAEVRDGVVVLKDGNLRRILAVSSVNFSLKSEEEQNAIIAGYQSFLNSLEYPIQILMQSRPMDVGPYLDLMKNRMSTITNQLLQMQIAEYIEFISRLTEMAKIMTKTFYVVVPYDINSVQQGLFGKISRILNPAHSVVLDTTAFEQHKAKLEERVSETAQRLGSMGLKALPLETAEVIELLYTSYNIGAASSLQGETIGKLDLEASQE